jgi:cytochrome c oxidase subunit 2
VVARGSKARWAATPSRRRTLRRVVGVALAGAATIGFTSACSVKEAFAFGWPLGPSGDGGITTQAHRMFNLWIGSVIAALAVGVLVWGLIFWCIVRYRKRGEALPPQTRYNMPIELLYSVAPFLVVSVLFYYTAVVQTDVNKLPDNPQVTVNVEPFKWNWKFSYPDNKGPDGNPVFTVGDDSYIPVLVLPVNETILFVEHSDDVIHSFWVPELLFKRDVFPGNVYNKFSVTLQNTGAYVGRCAELCGTYHSMMNFELRVIDQDQYAKFIADKEKGMSTPDALTDVGQNPYATTTFPFPSKRTSDATSVSK